MNRSDGVISGASPTLTTGLGVDMSVELPGPVPIALPGEDHLGVPGGERPPRARGAGLKDHGLALWRPGRTDRALDVEVRDHGVRVRESG